ncbi:MAG: hypothetical protein K6U14_09250 [Firmicutes bacterium]|nr:hypothetical protein [Alicyclobacillaceae bacterium]MCL6497797.1 hypothetical protein [Bacillota bacterium]
MWARRNGRPQDTQRHAVWDCGEAPTGLRRLRPLPVEGDGVWVRNRQGGGHEVQRAVAYEGKAPVGQDRRALVGRQVYAGVEAPRPFGETAVARWGETWDWGAVETTHLGSDGAACKQGAQYLPGAVHHPAPYPLRQAPGTACRQDPDWL